MEPASNEQMVTEPSAMPYKVLARGEGYMAISAQVDGEEWTGMLYSNRYALSTSRLMEFIAQATAHIPRYESPS